MKRGGPLKRSAPLERTQPLQRGRPRAPKSKGPRKAGAMDKGLRLALIARAAGSCEHCGKTVDKAQLHAHHRKLRTRGGEDSMQNLIAVAFDCHEWIHAHPHEAGEAGWMLHSWDDPAAALIYYRGERWIRLEAGG